VLSIVAVEEASGVMDCCDERRPVAGFTGHVGIDCYNDGSLSAYNQ
jgi:hypothetical protein